MKRRTAIKALAGGLAIAPKLLANQFPPQRTPVGRKGTLKKMVVVFQRGGNDGLNTLVPVETNQYNYYANLRPTVGLPQGALLNLPGSGFFGLHPEMSALLPIIQAGHCSMIHAVGYPNPDRSHFESQAYFETAVPGNGLLSGWLNRYLANTAGPGFIRGISIGSNIPQSVTGSVPVPVSNNFGETSVETDRNLSNADQPNYLQKIDDLYSLTPSAGNAPIYDTGGKIFQMLSNFADRDLNNYVPENGAVYPSSRLGDRVMHAAQMLKDDNFLGVEVVTIDQGGYDNHAGQIVNGNPLDGEGQHARLLRELSESMAAFYTDMGPVRMNDVVFLVVSEFGRRAYENDSFGTDHGTGSVAMVMGPSVNGAIINGDANWPGLATADLYSEDDLDWVTDFRDIYADILVNHLGADASLLSSVIPGHTHTPVGFI